METKIPRRIALTKVIEYASAIPLVGLLFKNYTVNKTYHTLDSSEAKAPDTFRQAHEFHAIQEAYGNSLDELCSAYRAAYRKTRTYQSGKTTVVQTYWTEEESVPHHGIVYGWRDQQETFARQSAALAQGQRIRADRVSSIQITQKTVSKPLHVTTATLLYGGGIVALLGYEEAMAHCTYNGWQRLTLAEKVEKMDSKQEIERRSFLKVGASLIGAGMLYPFARDNTIIDREERATLERELHRLSKEATVDTQRAFMQYFGKTPQDLIGQVDRVVSESSATLQRSVDRERVENAFLEVNRTGEAYARSLKELFIDGVPAKLGTELIEAHLAREVQRLSKQQNGRAFREILLEGGIVLGSMALVLIPGEYVNNKLG